MKRRTGKWKENEGRGWRRAAAKGMEEAPGRHQSCIPPYRAGNSARWNGRKSCLRTACVICWSVTPPLAEVPADKSGTYQRSDWPATWLLFRNVGGQESFNLKLFSF